MLLTVLKLASSFSEGKALSSDRLYFGAIRMAGIFVFPNLDSANIAYKIAQRIGGATAIGPVLQGLSMPANDLSRGCSADDVYHMLAVTVVQARYRFWKGIDVQTLAL